MQFQSDVGSEHEGPLQLSFAKKFLTGIVAVLPLLATIFAIVVLFRSGLSTTDLVLLLGMFFVSGFGITVGFHRYFTHRSFDTYLLVRIFLIIAGSMAIQGPLLKWVALHRRHHKYSDQEDDPHTPHLPQSGPFGLLRGIWHAHIGWAFTPDPTDLDHYSKDLRKKKIDRIFSDLFPLWAIAGLGVPMLIGGIVSGTWLGALSGLLWGGLVRLFMVHHLTWSVNSICHLFGSRSFSTKDQSRNNYLLGVLSLGEGWHNNHHAFPRSPRHGFYWWQLDLSFVVIRLMTFLGLAWNLRLPVREIHSR